jgi:hypothetical protein
LSPAALWDLVVKKRSAVTAVPAGRFGLDADLVRGTKQSSIDKTWSTRGGYVDSDAADLALGDFPGKSDVAGLDPLFRWVLGSAHRALAATEARAGQCAARAPRERRVLRGDRRARAAPSGSRPTGLASLRPKEWCRTHRALPMLSGWPRLPPWQ